MNGTKVDIAETAREVLVAEGYADCSMSRVAEGFDGSQSLIYHYFDDKEALLAAVVERERERVEAAFADLPDDPAARLEALSERVVGSFESGLEGDVLAALFVELRAAARQHDAVAAELDSLESVVRDELVDTVERGIEAGEFAAVSPEHVADLLLAANERAANARLLGFDADVSAALDDLVLASLQH